MVKVSNYRKPGTRDKHEFSKNINEDLEGRDFTINSIAYSIDKSILVDPFNGLHDILSGKIRASDSNLRVKEDPLRIMRAIRFHSNLFFNIDSELLNSIRKNYNLLNDVSIERIKAEFDKTILGKNVKSAFSLMLETGILELLIPEIIPSVGMEQNEYHKEDVYSHTISVVEAADVKLAVKLAALFHDFGKPHTLSVGEDGRRHFYEHEKVSAKLCKEIMLRFKYSNALIKKVTTLVRLHMRPLSCGPSGVRRLMRDLGDNFDDWLLLKKADKTPVMDNNEFQTEYDFFMKKYQEELERQKEPIYGKMAVNGNDLIELGFKEGVSLGKTLKRIEDMIIENPDLNTKDQLIALSKKFLNQCD